MSLPNCPQCNSEYVYEDGFITSFAQSALMNGIQAIQFEEEGLVVLDSNGTRLADGDSITIVKKSKK